jgi:hypothetical protein
LIECARCGVQFVPADPSGSAQADVELMPVDLPPPSPMEPKRSGCSLGLAAVVIPASVLLLCCGGIGIFIYLGKSSGSGVRSVLDAQPVATMQDQGLFNAYQDNEAAADLEYTGKTVEVWTLCAPLYDYTPRKDKNGSYYLEFNCGVGWLRVIFKGSETEKLARFEPNQNAKVVVRGVCRGISGNTVRVSDGVLVSVSEGNGLPRKLK